LSAKVAVTFFTLVIGTAQVVPVQSPLNPENTEFADGAAISVTSVFAVKFAEQVGPQSMPIGLEVTEPVPPPLFETLNAKVLRAKFALIVVAWLTVTIQVGDVVQPPPVQPVNNESLFAAAVSMIIVPTLYVSEQSLPHVMFGALTVPLPAPVFVMLSVLSSNAAVTFFDAFIVSMQVG
jgi:hypothetical protein